MATKMLFLHSETSVSNNIFKLDQPISGIWKFLSFNMTNNLFNVNDTNNKIYFDEGGTDRTATLTNGFYDINDLKTELTTALNNEASGTFTVTVDSNTRKFTFTNTGNFGFTFQTNTSNTGRKLIGMNATDDSQALSHTSDIPIDLNKYKNLFIRICQDDNNNVFGSSYFNSSLIINGSGSFGDLYTFISDDNYNQYVKFRNTKKLALTFHDINNNTIDLNSDYTILMEKIN